MKIFKVLFIVASFMGLIGVASPAASAAPLVATGSATLFHQDACDAIDQLGDSGHCGGNGAKGISKIIQAAVDILSAIVGVAAVIMIIISGFNYVTSNGEAAKVNSAKHTLIYAIVGLVIAASAQLIVRFVLSRIK